MYKSILGSKLPKLLQSGARDNVKLTSKYFCKYMKTRSDVSNGDNNNLKITNTSNKERSEMRQEDCE